MKITGTAVNGVIVPDEVIQLPEFLALCEDAEIAEKRLSELLSRRGSQPVSRPGRASHELA
jgi:hypothetical protein